MKTTIKYLMLALVAVFACVSISSCSKDDDDPNMGIGNYYFQLYTVESNCIDANGNNIADALKSEWISANQADAQGKKTIGKTDNESARPDFINASPKLRINGYFFKKRFYRLMFLCQKERFCKKTAVFR